MIPILAALFLLVGIAYKESLRNKWLALICFGPITFVSVIIMGQIDVVCCPFHIRLDDIIAEGVES